MRMNQALKGRHRFLADYAKACVALSGLNLNSILKPRVPEPAVRAPPPWALLRRAFSAQSPWLYAHARWGQDSDFASARFSPLICKDLLDALHWTTGGHRLPADRKPGLQREARQKTHPAQRQPASAARHQRQDPRPQDAQRARHNRDSR